MGVLNYDTPQVQRKLDNADTAPLSWNTSNLAVGDIEAIGIYDEDILTGEQITSAINPILPNTGTLNRHIILEVTTLTVAGTVQIQGDIVDEDTGGISVTTEDIVITATGCHQSSKKFLNTCTIVGLSTVDVVVDVHSTSYYDAQNQDFGVTSVRCSWTPSNPAWDMNFEVLKVNNNGSITNLTPLFVFDSTDTVPRAYNGKQGHAKVATNVALLGSQNEGLVVRVIGPTAILEAGIIIMITGLDPDTGLPFA